MIEDLDEFFFLLGLLAIGQETGAGILGNRSIRLGDSSFSLDGFGVCPFSFLTSYFECLFLVIYSTYSKEYKWPTIFLLF